MVSCLMRSLYLVSYNLGISSLWKFPTNFHTPKEVYNTCKDVPSFLQWNTEP